MALGKGKKMRKVVLIFLVLVGLMMIGCQQKSAARKATRFEPTWESLRQYKEVPQWLRDGKFGIYTHWGPYAVHAYGENTTWYSFALYAEPDGEARQHFEKNFGKLTPEFGYKDLIPKFTAEKFDAEEWAELFKKSGARFAGPVAEHHDGFAMWDTKYSEWNAAKMGPKRDVVGELEKAIKKRDMKFVTAFHHAANWFFFPVSDKRYDTGDPRYSGLYGQPHERGAMRNRAFLDEWYGKIIEVIDNYSPDFIWFDFALDSIPEGYVKDFLAYYYNHAEANNKEVVVTYKGNDLVPGSGVRDLELGQEPKITYHEWITDSTVDDRGAWGYANDLTFKTPDRLIDNLVDRVSKNGYLLLNVGPKPDGTIPGGARKLLLEMGAWLDVNGEAIYGTSPWFIAGEGPTNLGEATDIGFNEDDTIYTDEDIRFTVKGDVLYATFLAWPGEEAIIHTLRAEGDEEEEEEDEEEFGDEDEDAPSLAGKTFTTQDGEQEYTWVFKEDGKFVVSGGEAGEGTEGEYEQEGEEVFIEVAGFELEGVYDGETFEIVEDESPHYPGFYREEIKRITMLGDGRELNWELTRDGLIIETPDRKPCKHAFVFKIERYHHPKID
ncbi:MAG: alpha-L-fucosidase [Phycisphaerales bacterium]|nr:MAG: alpha-L-fucosidase [Phycisphaerales bacterium]